MKVLITGGSGFLGCNIIMNFSRWYKDLYVVNVDIRDNKWLQELDFVKTHISDASTFNFPDEHFDLILHCASEVGQENVVLNFRNTVRSNVLTLLNLLEKYPSTKQIFISSSEVYGFETNTKKLTEEDVSISNKYIKDKRSVYMLTKLLSENLTQFHDDAVVLRLFNVYGKYFGEHDTRIIPNILNRIKQGKDIVVYGDGNQSRDFTHVDDVCNIIQIILEKDVKNECFNICSGISYTINQVIYYILRYVPSTFTVKVTRFKHFKYDRTRIRHGCNKKVEEVLGYHHYKRLEDTVEEIVKWKLLET